MPDKPDDYRTKTLAKFFVGLGGGWLAHSEEDFTHERFLPKPLNEPYSPPPDGGAAASSAAASSAAASSAAASSAAASAAAASSAAASSAASSTGDEADVYSGARSARRRGVSPPPLGPRASAGSGGSRSAGVLLPGLSLEGEAAPGPNLTYGGYCNLGAIGDLRLWQVAGADGAPNGLLKGSLTFSGKGERHFHFTAFRSSSTAERTNCSYTDAELVGAVAREQHRLARKAKEYGGVTEFWRARAVDEQERAEMQAAVAAVEARAASGATEPVYAHGGESEEDSEGYGSGSSYECPSELLGHGESDEGEESDEGDESDEGNESGEEDGAESVD